jgi:hypothetical protein
MKFLKSIFNRNIQKEEIFNCYLDHLLIENMPIISSRPRRYVESYLPTKNKNNPDTLVKVHEYNISNKNIKNDIIVINCLNGDFIFDISDKYKEASITIILNGEKRYINKRVPDKDEYIQIEGNDCIELKNDKGNSRISNIKICLTEDQFNDIEQDRPKQRPFCI